MRIRMVLISVGVLTVMGSGCSRQEAPKAPEFKATSTVRDIMSSMVMPGADILWNAVSSSVTDKGVVEKVPTTEQEWKDVRSGAITLLEAADLILIPGRRMAAAGQTAEDPKVQLTPEQIEKLIADDPAGWTQFAHDLHDSVLPALKAIDAKDATALADAGGAIDKACESCHLKYWYPNQPKN